MFDYTGSPCPYCNQLFQKSDDVAVCPDCGTPHHRDCYVEHSACANESLHDAGFDWSAQNAGEVSSAAQTFPCPGCGRDADAASVFCNHCGMPFAGHISPYTPTATPMARQASAHAAPQQPPMFAGAGQKPYRAKEFDGIPVEDWQTYIGRSAAYYLLFFQSQDDTGRKTSFTFSAAVFPVLYFLYRKLWLLAAAAFGVTCVLNTPFLLLQLSEFGFLSGINTALWSSISSYTNILSYAVNLFWGLYAVYLFRKSTANKLRAMKLKSGTEQDYHAQLARSAGPSVTAVAIPLFFLVMFMMLATILFP